MIEIDRLSAERGHAVDQHDCAAEPCRFERGGRAGDPAPTTQISAQTRRGVPAAGRRTVRVAVGDLGLVRVHRWSARCHRRTLQVILAETQLAQIDAVGGDPVSPGSAARPNTIET